MNKIILPLMFFLFMTLSCENEEDNEILDAPIPEIVNIDSDVDVVIKNVYYSMPSPIEMAIIVEKHTKNFAFDSLHDPQKSSNYITMNAKALNLGIYASDLTLTSVFEQTQSNNVYFETVLNFAKDLGIVEGINDTMITKIYANLDNPNKVKEIIAEAFFKSDAYLKENNKKQIASLILTGAWIENIYMLSKLTSKNIDSSVLTELFIDQRLILENVKKITTGILDEETNSDLDQLNHLFNDCVNVTQKQVIDPYTDSIRNKTIVKYDYNSEKISKISEKISIIRKNFVSLQ